MAVPAFASLVDSRGNSYGSSFDSSAGTGNATAAVAIASGVITTALQVGDTITLTLGETRIRWAIEADAFDDPVKTSTLDKVQANHTPGNSSSLTTNSSATLSQPRELAVAAFGGGVRTYTATGGFAGGPSVDTTAGSTDRSLFLEYAYVESATPGTVAGTCTVDSSTTYTACLATYRSWVPAGRRSVSRAAGVRASRW